MPQVISREIQERDWQIVTKLGVPGRVQNQFHRHTQREEKWRGWKEQTL